jgi:hypothetical protein
LLNAPGVAQVLIWPEQAERALNLLNKLCHAAERAGYRITLSDSKAAALEVEGEEIGFEISELYSRQERPLPDRNKWEWRRSGLGDLYRARASDPFKQWEYVPSGKLRLVLHGAWGQNLRQKWTDGISRRVESQLPSVLAEVAAHAAAIREWRDERKRAEAAAEEAERRREEARELRKREEQRQAFLAEKVEAYDDAQRFEDFVTHLHRMVGTFRPPQLAAFLAWADEHIQSLRAAYSIENIERELALHDLFS